MRSKILDQFYSQILPVLAHGWTILLRREEIDLPNNAVLLTFDDGPDKRVTPELLKVLHSHKVSACFCVIGTEVEAHPDITMQIADAGHVLVNHGYEHRLPIFNRKSSLREDIVRCDQALADALGNPDYRSHVYRPPGGWYLKHVRSLTNELDLRIAPITYYPIDNLHGSKTAHILIDRCCEQLIHDRGGSIVFHEAVYGASTLRKNLGFWMGQDRTWLPQGVDDLITRLIGEGLHVIDAEEHFANESGATLI